MNGWMDDVLFFLIVSEWLVVCAIAECSAE